MPPHERLDVCVHKTLFDMYDRSAFCRLLRASLSSDASQTTQRRGWTASHSLMACLAQHAPALPRVMMAFRLRYDKASQGVNTGPHRRIADNAEAAQPLRQGLAALSHRHSRCGTQSEPVGACT